MTDPYAYTERGPGGQEVRLFQGEQAFVDVATQTADEFWHLTDEGCRNLPLVNPDRPGFLADPELRDQFERKVMGAIPHELCPRIIVYKAHIRDKDGSPFMTAALFYEDAPALDGMLKIHEAVAHAIDGRVRWTIHYRANGSWQSLPVEPTHVFSGLYAPLSTDFLAKWLDHILGRLLTFLQDGGRQHLGSSGVGASFFGFPEGECRHMEARFEDALQGMLDNRVKLPSWTLVESTRGGGCLAAPVYDAMPTERDVLAAHRSARAAVGKPVAILPFVVDQQGGVTPADVQMQPSAQMSADYDAVIAAQRRASLN